MRKRRQYMRNKSSYPNHLPKIIIMTALLLGIVFGGRALSDKVASVFVENDVVVDSVAMEQARVELPHVGVAETRVKLDPDMAPKDMGLASEFSNIFQRLSLDVLLIFAKGHDNDPQESQLDGAKK